MDKTIDIETHRVYFFQFLLYVFTIETFFLLRAFIFMTIAVSKSVKVYIYQENNIEKFSF